MNVIRSVVLTRRRWSRASFAVLIGVAAASLGACKSTSTPSAPTYTLVGRWVLTASANPGIPSGINTRIKTFTENEWVVEQTTTSGAVVFRHGGHYTLLGTAYTETVEFANASTANLVGQTFTATLNLGDNQFTQSAPFAETWTRMQ